MDPTSGYARNKKLIYIAIAVLLIGLIVLLVLAIAFFNKPRVDPGLLNPTVTPSLIVTQAPITITPSVIVNNDAKLFYIASSELYSFNSMSRETKNIDNGNSYAILIGFNSSNKYLAYVSTDDHLYFRDMSSSTNVRSVKLNEYLDLFWMNENEFIVVYEDGYMSVSAPQFLATDQININFPSASTFISISPDLTWVLARENSRLERSYLLNTQNGKIQYLELFDLDDSVAFNFLNWLAPARLIFFNSIGLSSLNPDSMVQTRLLSFNININTADKLTPLMMGMSDNEYFFSYNGKLYKYIEGTLINTQILDLKDYNFFDLKQVVISPNGKYASFDRGNGAAIIINLSTLSSLSLCDFDCHDPVWEY